MSAKEPTRAGDITTSGSLEAWIREEATGLAVSTGDRNRLLTFGVQPDGRWSVCECVLDHAGPIDAAGGALVVATRSRVIRYVHGPVPGRLPGDAPPLFAPRVITTTGEIGIQDLALGRGGEAFFASAQFNCVATLDARHSFRPIARPPFVSRFVAEDRCHLSGVAVRDGAPRYATAFAQSDTAGGFRARLRDGGCVVDLASGAVIAEGLSMPRSPRWHADRLWILEAGTGRLGWIDVARGAFNPIAFCPGLVCGLAFVGDRAVVGLSRPAASEIRGLALEGTLKSKGTDPRCGVHVVDLRSGDVAHWIRLGGPFREVTGVAALTATPMPFILQW